MRKTRYTALKVVGEFLCIVSRVLRSALFNVLIFILGFGCAYVFTVNTIEENTCMMHNSETIKQLEKGVEQLQASITHFQKQIEQYKFALTHKTHSDIAAKK